VRALAIDFETANEQRSSACAVGLAWIEDGSVVRRAYRLIRPPEMRFSPFNTKVHGLTARDVEGAGAFPDVMGEFLGELSSHVLLAHNAAFDVGVLLAGLEAYGRQAPEFDYLCTVKVAQAAWPRHPRHSLDAVARLLGIEFRHHHAGEDAEACARVALAAARSVGAHRLGDVPGLLGLALGSVRAAGHRPCGAPGREVSRRGGGRAASSLPHGSPAADDGPAFLVRGSTGNRYRVRLGSSPAGPVPVCTCMAGRNRRLCRHVRALLDGDVTDLLSDNAAEVPGFVARLSRGGGADRG
jgi:DNA polymerase-3 subunit epsilon